jgi:hypothetical protein
MRALGRPFGQHVEKGPDVLAIVSRKHRPLRRAVVVGAPGAVGEEVHAGRRGLGLEVRGDCVGDAHDHGEGHEILDPRAPAPAQDVGHAALDLAMRAEVPAERTQDDLAGLLEAPVRRPVNIAEFLARSGGIARDPGGDLAAMDLHRQSCPAPGCSCAGTG